MTQSNWAILLVKFSDDTQPDPPMKKYQDLFTSQGSGKLNMVDFFHDMSLGVLDLSGSQVFGRYTLSAKRSDYGKTVDRNGIMNLARTAATNAGVNLGDYQGVVVCALGTLDLCGWIGGMQALCDDNSLSPSLLGQEMGHGYGLDHARINGSTADYQDPWDVMSTQVWPSMQADSPDWGNNTIGPGMNAQEIQSRGWLDESRVWNLPSPSSGEYFVDLRPLHRPDLPGFLAAKVGEYLVEFRVPQRWDAAIPRACILVHRFEDNHSYLMPSAKGSDDIVEGDQFEFSDPNHLPYYVVEVVKIDQDNLTATIKVHGVGPPIIREGPGIIIGGITVDGSGIIIIGGRIIRVPPWGPEFQIMAEMARYLSTEFSSNNVEAALTMRRKALEAITHNVNLLYSRTNAISEQPPGYRNDEINPRGRRQSPEGVTRISEKK